MALLLRSDGQGNPGDAVTNANSSGPDQFTSALVSGAGNTLQYAVVAGFNGGGAVQATIGATAGAGYVTWSFTAVTTAYSRIYAKFGTLPSSNTRLIAYTDTAGALLRSGLYIDTAGHLITVDSAGSTIATSTSTITAGSVFRVELDTTGNAGAGVVTCRLYLTPGGTSPSETLSNTGLATGGTIGQIWVGSSDAGATNTAPAVGDLQVNDTGPVGPASLRVRNNTAEGQASGTALTTGNSGGGSGDAYDSVSKGVAGAAAFDNAQFMHGTQSYHVTGGATDTAIMIYSGASDTAGSIRFYVRFNTLPSSAQTLMAIRNGTGFAATFGISATNKFTVGNAAGAVLSTFTTTLSTGVWYRCEMEAVVGTLITTGTISGRYFLGDALTAQDTPYTSNVVNSGITSFTNGRFGKQTAGGTGFDVWIDDTSWSPGTSTPLGPSLATLSPASIPTSETVGYPAVSATYTISPASIATGENVGNPTVTPGAVTVSPASIGSDANAGFPTVTYLVTPTGIPSGEQVGSPTVTPGAVTINPASIPSAAAASFPVITTTATVAPASIPSSETVGAATVTPGAVTVSPFSIPTEERVGNITITVLTAINPYGIASTATVGNPSITPGQVTVSPASIPTGEAVGSPIVSAGTATVNAYGIASTATVGNPAVTAGQSTVTAYSISSSEQFGNPAVVNVQTVTGYSIRSGEAFGSPTVTAAPSRIVDIVNVLVEQGRLVNVQVEQDKLVNVQVEQEPLSGSLA